jgi:hypothetical protein
MREGGTATVTVDGPAQPGRSEHGTGNLSSGWFILID